MVKEKEVIKEDCNPLGGSDQNSKALRNARLLMKVAVFLPVIWLCLVLYAGFAHNSHHEYCEMVAPGETYDIILERSPCRLTMMPLMDVGLGMILVMPFQFLSLVFWMFAAWKARKRTKKRSVRNFYYKALVFSAILPWLISLPNIGYFILTESFQNYCVSERDCTVLGYIFSDSEHWIHRLSYAALFQLVVLLAGFGISVFGGILKSIRWFSGGGKK